MVEDILEGEEVLTGNLLLLGRPVIVGVKYPEYRGSPVMAQNSRYDRFPPAAIDWGSIHPVPHKAQPL
jgi:hypothetical protein